ncbi:MAG: TIGR00268 family protein, partial [Methanomicrobiales archaeon]
MPVADKKRALEQIIAGCGSMLVSFSGGVDSTLLAVLARDLLGERSRSILLDSPVVPRAAVADAKKIAQDLGIKLDIIEVPHMEDEKFRTNPPERCYYCKKISA